MIWGLVLVACGLWSSGPSSPDVEATPLCQGAMCPSAQAFQCGDPITPGCFFPVEGGTVLRGAQATDPAAPGFDRYALPDDGAPTERTVGPYLIQATEATNHQWAACVEAGACPKEGAPDGDGQSLDLPASRLDLEAARALCSHLGGRLPTEVEWEHAAMAGGRQRFAWGDFPRCAHYPKDEVDRLQRHRTEMLQRCPTFGSRAVARFTTAQLERAAETFDAITAEQMDQLCAEVTGASDAEAPNVALAAIERLRSAGELPTCEVSSVALVASEYTRHPWKLMWLSGNVAEWVDADGDPVLKGGSFLALDPTEWRIAARGRSAANLRAQDVGVRCVRERTP